MAFSSTVGDYAEPTEVRPAGAGSRAIPDLGWHQGHRRTACPS